MNRRVSFERLAIDQLEAALGPMAGVTLSRGMGAANRFQVPAWELPVLQHFQFGDLRLVSEHAVVIVEVESGGGLSNLVKYWPLLEANSLQRRFVLVHAFRVTSEGDYSAHRRLWEYLVERMRADLEERAGVRWPADWEAEIFTYYEPSELHTCIPFIRRALK